jgi:hypothetical protein
MFSDKMSSLGAPGFLETATEDDLPLAHVVKAFWFTPQRILARVVMLARAKLPRENVKIKKAVFALKTLRNALGLLILGAVLSSCSVVSAELENPADSVSENFVGAEGEASDLDEDELSTEAGPYVDVTFPRSHFGSKTDEQIRIQGQEERHQETLFNSDGTVTSRMKDSTRDELLQNLIEEISEGIEETLEEKPSVFKRISHEDDLNAITFEVDRSAFEADSDAIWAKDYFALLLTYAQIYRGVSPDDRLVTVNFQDSLTGDVFYSEQAAEWWW